MSEPGLVRIPKASGSRAVRLHASPQPRSISATVLEIGERISVLTAFALFYAANISVHRPLNVLVVATDGLTVLFVLFRRPAAAISRSPMDWVVAAVGTFCTLFMRPGGESLLHPALATGLIVGAVLLSIAAKFSLNLSFGIGPANRGIQTGGVYAFVRHPMYLGYLILTAVFALMNPTAWNLVLLVCAVGAQFDRIRREERFLLRDPAYRGYAERVRHRLLPGVF